MHAQSLRISDIKIEESPFLPPILPEPGAKNLILLKNSVNSTGLLTPVLVYRDKESSFHLIDGKKRISIARENGNETIEAKILPADTPLSEIINVICYTNSGRINLSPVNKVLFVLFARSTGVEEDFILHNLCKMMGFKPHSSFLDECEKINRLPHDLKLFCHEKGFSYKQILNLANYPAELLAQLAEWKDCFHFTASILDEVASNLRDYLRANNKSLKEFIEESAIDELINSDLSKGVKREKLRTTLYLLRFPILNNTNAGIEKRVKDLKLPENIKIKWDRTLENRGISFAIDVQDESQWPDVMKVLESGELKMAIKDILDEL